MSGSPDPLLLEQFRSGKRSALARAISLVENRAPGFETLLHQVYPSLGRSRRIGITGPPGAGKSTLTAQLTGCYRERDERVAVVAVDPSSPYTGGALLGDRIRMAAHFNDPGVFIRSMSVRGSAGGVAAATSETVDLLDAFGFDVVLLEGVGSGQSDVAIADCIDTTVLVLTPEAGDAVQAMKAGLMEIADIFVVNKADRSGADRLVRDVEAMLRLRDSGAQEIGTNGEESFGGEEQGSASGPGWKTPVLLTSAQEGKGLDSLMAALDLHATHLQTSGDLAGRRRRRWAARTRYEVDRELSRIVWTEQNNALLREGVELMEAGKETPYSLALRIARGGSSE